MARLSLARIAFTLALIATIWGSLAPLSDVEFASGVWDKAQHAFGYGLLTLLLVASQRVHRPWQAGFIVLTIGICIEIAQGLTPDRSMDVRDLLANALGIAVASGIVSLWQRLPSNPRRLN